MKIDVTNLPYPPDVAHTEDGTMCLCCGAMVAHCRHGAWDSDPHDEDCNTEDEEREDGSLVVAVCRDEDGSKGCGWACLVPAWADEDLIVGNGCRGCTGGDSELVIVHGKDAAEAQAAVDALLAGDPVRSVSHSQGHPCPRCAAPAFCDDCAFCKACGFAAPDVAIVQPPPPAPKRRCRECGGASAHTRTCSVTLNDVRTGTN